MGAFMSRPWFGHKNAPVTDPWDLSTVVKKSKPQPSKSGGFSDVYEGVLQPRSQKVAIKSLRAVKVGNNNPDSRETHERLDKRLKREMRVWKPLNHPRIVPCLGFAMVDNMPCLISPWYANGSSKEYIETHPSCDRKVLIAQVAEGLVYLHSRDPAIVHYDVKSLNVLIGDDGGAMLTDFGIAKVIEDARTGLTTTNATAFTVRCSSPEALEGKERDVKSDVYSFGCFALEIMTGKAPFYDLKTSAAVIAAKYNGALPTPAQFPQLPESDPLWGLMRKCWDTDPLRRPTMVEVLAELNTLGYRA